MDVEDEMKSDNDFNFETLDKKNNIIPFELFENEYCLLNLPNTWFKEFDDLLSVETVNLLCNAIVDITDLEKDKKDGNGDKKKVNKNPMYIDKVYLKKQRIVSQNKYHNNNNQY